MAHVHRLYVSRSNVSVCALHVLTLVNRTMCSMCCHVGDIFVHLDGADACDESQWN